MAPSLLSRVLRGGITGKQAAIALVLSLVALLFLRALFLLRRASRRAAVRRPRARRAGPAADAAAADAGGGDGTKGPRAVVALEGVVLRAKPGMRYEAVPGAAEALVRLCGRGPLFGVLHVREGGGDVQEWLAAAKAELEAMGAFGAGLRPHRVLPCTTTKGATAIVRHLEPGLLVCDDAEIVDALQPFVARVLWVQGGRSVEPKAAPNVLAVDGLVAAAV